MFQRLLFFAALPLSLGFAPAPFESSDSKAELKKLQGKWDLVRQDFRGVSSPEDPVRTKVVIAGSSLTYFDRGKEYGRWAITLDATKRPKVFDTRKVGANGRGEVYWGIYRLKGDTLTVCSQLSSDSRDRPATFDSASGHAVIIQVFKRRKR